MVISLLLIAICCAFLARSINAVNDTLSKNLQKLFDTLDFTPLINAVQYVIDRSQAGEDDHSMQPAYPITALSTSDDCHLPSNSSIILTYSTNSTLDLLRLQYQSMNATGMGRCLYPRFITVCLDEKCKEYCDASKIPPELCPLIVQPQLPVSTHGKGAYNYVTFLKHHLMYEALKIAQYAFLIDADVLLFRNPFVEAIFLRTNSCERAISTNQLDRTTLPRRAVFIDAKLKFPVPDLVFQIEQHRGSICSGGVNTGQYFLRKSNRTLLFLNEMFKRRKDVINGVKLDQGYVAEAAKAAHAIRSSLPMYLFTSHCFRSV